MVTAPNLTESLRSAKTFIERWYFTGIATVMIATSIAGFAPAIVDPSRRHAPVTLLAAAHGIFMLAWLLLFLIQSLLVATGRVGWHRRLGLTSVVLLALIVPLTFETTAAMVRRGFDLSGDSHISPRPQVINGKAIELDAPTASAFNFGFLLEFTLLASASIAYRRKPEVHKRLMLFANIVLMAPPIQHLIGHIPSMVLTPAAVSIPFAIFLLAGVFRDYLVAGRIRPLTAILAIALFLAMPLLGAVIGPSAAWRQIAIGISR